jgi:CMP-N,N'-diacetyllegionaminic acid synthase
MPDKVNNYPSIWAIVPARSGSKRFPKKNLASFRGLPLVTNTLNELNKIKMTRFNLILSSDSDEILKLGMDISRCNLHKRFKSADDNSTADEVVIEILESFKDNFDFESDWLLYCQATSPLTKSSHYLAAIELSVKTGTNVVSVNKKPLHVEKMITLDSNGMIEIYSDEGNPTLNSQFSKKIAYLPNGAIYLFKICDFRKKMKFPISGSIPLLMSPIESIDIDDPEDLELAERITKNDEI